jgi:prolyl-tRNA synthetase
LFRLKDRKGADLCLGMTHEEVMTDIARRELRSYKQLPQIWYQIQTKFRDEPRPKSGLLRVRQFTMKDSYSFDLDAAGLDESYRKHDAAYRAIFTRCGLEFVAVEADSGAMGGSQSQEFMVYSDAGEDLIVSCAQCGYAANIEKATSRLAPVEDLAASGDGAPELVHTPGQRTIEEVGAFLRIEPQHQLKTMVYIAQQPLPATGTQTSSKPRSVKVPGPVMVVAFLRGDHSVNEAKLESLIRQHTGAADVRPALLEEIQDFFGSEPGYLGPVGLPATWQGQKPLILLDAALEHRGNFVAGANRSEYHLRNVTPGRDFTPTAIADLRNAAEGEGCPNCGAPLRVAKAVEIGHIFKLGYRYSESMGARVLDPQGKEVMPIMGCYGIGIERILTSAIEQSYDENGFWLPPAIAPFDVVVTITNTADPALFQAGESIAADLERAGFDVLLDDRDERAGVKFKDAELIGIPFRINVGKKVASGAVELVSRKDAADRSKVLEVAIPEVAEQLAAMLRQQVLAS